MAENYNISRPAISKHIKVLTECGLIEIKQEGRERYCTAKLDKPSEVNAWITQCGSFGKASWMHWNTILIKFKNKNKLNE